MIRPVMENMALTTAAESAMMLMGSIVNLSDMFAADVVDR